MESEPRGLVAFDLDGTLLRGPTVCDLLAAPLGRQAEMKRFESFSSDEDIRMAREEMATWYRDRDLIDLLRSLDGAAWAPGAKEGVGMLQEAGVEVVIASITWSFAVSWFADRLGIRHFLGTKLLESGGIEHVWAREKAEWFSSLAAIRMIPQARLAAVGDSAADRDLLSVAAVRVFVGVQPPPTLENVIHLPGADIRTVARRILRDLAA